MGIKLITKPCRQCGIIMYNISSKIQICDNCREENKKQHMLDSIKKKSEQNMKEAYKRVKYHIEKYTKDGGKTLTPKGFDEVSPLNSYSILNTYRKPWVEILEMFGKDKELKDYIKYEYQKYKQCNNDKTYFRLFIKNHEYINENVFNSFNLEELIEFCDGIRRRINYSEEECKENFINLKNKLGYIPTYNEFIKLTEIGMHVYINKFNLKGKMYNTLIKMYFSNNKQEYNNYLLKQKEIRKENAEKAGIHINKYSNEELEEEFKKVFDKTKEKYNVYPSRKYFNKMSRFDDSLYRHRFNKSWTEICKMFGYDITNKKSAEYIVLGMIREILQADYISQKSWNWLKGIKGCALRVDGYFENYNLAVEFDGRQHDEPIEKYGGKESYKVLKSNDEIKDNSIPEHGIKLLRISAFNDWFNEEYLKERLINIGIKLPTNKYMA